MSFTIFTVAGRPVTALVSALSSAVAQEAGISREALYRALSPTGNPTLKTLLAVLHAVDMRLSVAPAEPDVSHA